MDALVRERILACNWNSPGSAKESRLIAELCHLLFAIDENLGSELARYRDRRTNVR